MGKKGITKNGGIQRDLYGNQVHMLNVKEMYRMVKCGNCGEIVKSSQAKLHISFGEKLSICKKCLQESDSKRRVANTDTKDSLRIVDTIESYSMNTIKA
jgi:hypothetical protein